MTFSEASSQNQIQKLSSDRKKKWLIAFYKSQQYPLKLTETIPQVFCKENNISSLSCLSKMWQELLFLSTLDNSYPRLQRIDITSKAGNGDIEY